MGGAVAQAPGVPAGAGSAAAPASPRATRRGALAVLLGAAAWAAGCATSPGAAEASDDVRVLAPTGRLRVALYLGSPTSIVGDVGSPDARGIALDLGRALAARLGVPFEPMVHPRNAEALAAVKEGRADVAFTNATPARAADMDFTPPFLSVEQGCLVPPGSPVATLAAIDRPGVRVGVSVGSTSEALLGRELRQARVVRTPSIDAAIAMLRDGRLDAFATNKAILFEMSDRLPGARVLDGRWGLEHFAAGIPKGRERGLPALRTALAVLQADGSVARAVARAGVRGTVASPAR